MTGTGQESPPGNPGRILQLQTCHHVLAGLHRGVLERRKTRMAFAQSPQPDDPGTKDVLLRPQVLRPADRHILLGVSHASNDPALHRSFEILATYDMNTHGWIAHVGEQNLNEQRGAWAPLDDEERKSFPTAAACLGHAVAAIISAFDRDDEANE